MAHATASAGAYLTENVAFCCPEFLSTSCAESAVSCSALSAGAVHRARAPSQVTDTDTFVHGCPPMSTVTSVQGELVRQQKPVPVILTSCLPCIKGTLYSFVTEEMFAGHGVGVGVSVGDSVLVSDALGDVDAVRVADTDGEGESEIERVSVVLRDCEDDSESDCAPALASSAASSAAERSGAASPTEPPPRPPRRLPESPPRPAATPQQPPSMPPLPMR